MSELHMPPGSYFISHSYKDREIVEEMKKLLPKSVKPFIFPAIAVEPDEFVSNHLIEAILEQDAVIVISGEFSDKSFWVAFERDFALRNKKPVYVYSHVRKQLTRLEIEPLELRIFPVFSLHDLQVQRILEFMKEERHFYLSDWISKLSDYSVEKVFSEFGDYFKKLEANQHDDMDIAYRTINSLKKILNEATDIEKNIKSLQHLIRAVTAFGGYVVVFHSRNASKEKYAMQDLLITIRANTEGRILFALLDSTPLPQPWGLGENPYSYLFDEGLEEKLKERIFGSNIQEVQLYSDEERGETQRIDDLIVNLYWLVFQNQFQELVYE